MNTTDTMNFFENNEGLQPFFSFVEQIMALDDADLNDDKLPIIKGALMGAFTPKVREEAISSLVQNARAEGMSKFEVTNSYEQLLNSFNDYIDSLSPSEPKRTLINTFLDTLNEIFVEASARFGAYDIMLPIKLEENAQVPSYAHGLRDAAADLYAAETVVLGAHSLGTIIKTNVKIALPEGWVGYILPRSSMGVKTGLRLSNSVGVIDDSYRGQLGVIYDNIADEPYTIKQGDRIAQLIVMPAYHFMAQVVDILPTSERGEGGFGSTGK